MKTKNLLIAAAIAGALAAAPLVARADNAQPSPSTVADRMGCNGNTGKAKGKESCQGKDKQGKAKDRKKGKDKNACAGKEGCSGKAGGKQS
jgi:hypothetical protein